MENQEYNNLTAEQMAYKIFSSICYSEVNDDGLLKHIRNSRKWLYARLNKSIFLNEYAIFYDIFHKYDNDVLDSNVLFTILQTSKHKFSASPIIDLNLYVVEDGTEEDTVNAFITSVMDKYTEMCDEIVTFEEVKIYTELYIDNYQKEIFGSVLVNTSNILVNGIEVKHKIKKGYADAKESMLSSVNKIDSLTKSLTQGEGRVKMDTEYYYRMTSGENHRLRKLMDYPVNELNQIYGSIYAGDMISCLAPTKGGKTRFCANLVHHGVVNNKLKVCVWPLENNHDAWHMYLRIRHFDWLYNTHNKDGNLWFNIDYNDIRTQNYTSDEYKQMEYASFWDFDSKRNIDYGSVDFIDEAFNSKTFVSVLTKAFEEEPFDILVIDYLQKISEDGSQQKNQMIGGAYQDLLTLQKTLGFASILPAQFKSDVVEKFAKTGDFSTLRNSGAESSEVIKTPDILFAMYASEEDMLVGKMQIVPIPSRYCAFAKPFWVATNLGLCDFSSIET